VTSGNQRSQSLDSQNAEPPKCSGVSEFATDCFSGGGSSIIKESQRSLNQKPFHQTQLESLRSATAIATDGFGFYRKIVRRVFGPACLYGQVIKTRRKDRIVKVDRRAVIGEASRLEETLRNSEDSSKLNTSFVERLNLTIRQGSAYLFRRTLYHARWKERLEEHLELLRCYYNFVRPHRALRFGAEFRTPAMQARLTKQQLTLREIFPPAMLL
jgi:hypothetical protein